MPVCFDQGSENYWVLEPGAVYNFGCAGLGCLGPCNISASPFYDYSASPDATEPVPFDYSDIYGGYSKIVLGNATFEDTLTFTSVAGQKSTIPGIRTALVNLITVRGADESGTCAAEGITYDVGILGTAPYQQGPEVRRARPKSLFVAEKSLSQDGKLIRVIIA
jgi:hypothetical protein